MNIWIYIIQNLQKELTEVETFFINKISYENYLLFTLKWQKKPKKN